MHIPFEPLDNKNFELNRLLWQESPDGFQGISCDEENPIVIIEGAPGTGKTTFILQSAIAAAKSLQGFKVVLCSSEQSQESLINAAFAFGMISSKRKEDSKFDFFSLNKTTDIAEVLLNPRHNGMIEFAEDSFKDAENFSALFPGYDPSLSPALYAKFGPVDPNDYTIDPIKSLVTIFNKVLDDDWLLNQIAPQTGKPTITINISDETRTLVDTYNKMIGNPAATSEGKREMLRRINRSLLEDAYPNEISRLNNILCLTHHFDTKPNDAIFENWCRAFESLRQSLQAKNDKSKLLIYIDSLNGMDAKPPERKDVAKLFGKLRELGVPAVITVERDDTEHFVVDARMETAQSAAFSADVVIRLSRSEQAGYLLNFLQVIKSRVGRQALGRHLYKSRTKENAKLLSLDSRKGIVVYPSVHAVLSRTQNEEAPPIYDFCQACPNDQAENKPDIKKATDLWMVMQNHELKGGECVGIVGPHGTHKLALALNLATGKTKGGKVGKLLIVHFGDNDVIGDFDGIAWTDERKEWRNVKRMPEISRQRQKFWLTRYGVLNSQNEISDGSPSAVCINFRIGELTPEECFYIIDKAISEEKPTAVLATDTAELWGGFPLLRSPEFFSALIDLFGNHKIFSVITGVQEPRSNLSEALNFALLARANYRITLSHHPETKELIQNLAQNVNTQTRQQKVSLIIDNVTGKNYSRAPIWLKVDQIYPPGGLVVKTLTCSTNP